MDYFRKIFLVIALFVGFVSVVHAQGKSAQYALRVVVTDSITKESLVGAVCQIKSLNAFSVTDNQGIGVLQHIPRGTYSLEISCLGFQPVIRRVELASDLRINVKMVETSLELKEVMVVAKNSAAGEATATRIGRQAIEHLQATSLADLTQLIPGQLIQNNSLTSQQQMTFRSVSSTADANNSFGASVIVDGVPQSNNATLHESTGNSTAGSGIDLRQISTDNIESVEVIRGIPSAEYGDLTSGAVIVNLKSGRTPFEVRTKVNPTTINSSFDKGWRLGNKSGFLNSSFDYAQAWGDPRLKKQSFDRISGSLIHSITLMRKWKMRTKVGVNSLIDWNGQDPDEVINGTKLSQNDLRFQFNHDGRLALNLPFSRTLSYVIGYSTQYRKSENSSFVSKTGLIPILNAMETDYYDVPFQTSSYLASGGFISKPQNIYAKITNTFGLNIHSVINQFNMGVEYRNESNHAKGYYNDNDLLPLKPNSDGRPRPYYDIPALNQLSGFLEDNIKWTLFGMKYTLQAGLRYTHLQPGKEEQVWSLSPRLNLSVQLHKAVTLRAGYGKNAKTPGLIHLYPDKKYIDRLAADNTAAANPEERMLLYHTYVYDVKRTTGLKNVTNTKMELGADIKLPGNRSLSIIAYWDKTPNGFGNFTDYFTYTSNFYKMGYGMIAQPNQKPLIDKENPARVDTVYATKGMYGNVEWRLNRGVEFDLDLGRIEAWNTSFYLSGAYMETQSRFNGLRYSTPSDIVGSAYVDANCVPFKYIYPGGLQTQIDRRFSTQARAVINIPRIRMVLSTAWQVVWYSYTATTNQQENPIAYITANKQGGVDHFPITSDMLNDPDCKIKGSSLQKARLAGKDNPPVTQPPLLLMTTRLTKDISKIAGFSFYANNTFFYQPWQHSSVSSTLTERNQGTFSFGAELYLKF